MAFLIADRYKFRCFLLNGIVFKPVNLVISCMMIEEAGNNSVGSGLKKKSWGIYREPIKHISKSE